MTAGGLMGGLGPRERRWLLGFLILGSAYFAVLLLQMAFAFMAGFSQIILIIFLAWLLAFIMSPIARFLEERLPLSRPLAVVVCHRRSPREFPPHFARGGARVWRCATRRARPGFCDAPRPGSH